MTAVACGGGHAAAAAGRLYCWGDSSRYQCGARLECVAAEQKRVVEEAGSDVVAVACGGQFTAAVAAGGACHAFGANDFGQLGRAPSAVGAPAAIDFRAAAASWDRDVGAVFAGRPVALAAGDDHLLVAMTSGLVASCGGDGAGQRGWAGDRALPQLVRELVVVGVAVVGVAAGGDSSAALSADGALYAWGAGGEGQLGAGGREDSAAPRRVDLGGATCAAVALGEHHGVAVAGGRLYAWGSATQDKLGGAPARDAAARVVQRQLRGGLARWVARRCAAEANGGAEDAEEEDTEDAEEEEDAEDAEDAPAPEEEAPEAWWELEEAEDSEDAAAEQGEASAAERGEARSASFFGRLQAAFAGDGAVLEHPTPLDLGELRPVGVACGSAHTLVVLEPPRGDGGESDGDAGAPGLSGAASFLPCRHLGCGALLPFEDLRRVRPASALVGRREPRLRRCWHEQLCRVGDGLAVARRARAAAGAEAAAFEAWSEAGRRRDAADAAAALAAAAAAAPPPAPDPAPAPEEEEEPPPPLPPESVPAKRVSERRRVGGGFVMVYQ